jgi:hypothetical protein
MLTATGLSTGQIPQRILENLNVVLSTLLASRESRIACYSYLSYYRYCKASYCARTRSRSYERRVSRG